MGVSVVLCCVVLWCDGKGEREVRGRFFSLLLFLLNVSVIERKIDGRGKCSLSIFFKK